MDWDRGGATDVDAGGTDRDTDDDAGDQTDGIGRGDLVELLEPDGGVSKEAELGILVKDVVEAHGGEVTLWLTGFCDLDSLVETLKSSKLLVG